MAGAGAGIVQARSQSQDLDQQRQVLAERRREIEERTLASSERGLGLLYESEKVGGLLVTSSERQDLPRRLDPLLKRLF